MTSLMILLGSLALTACSNPTLEATLTPRPTGLLTPFHTLTPSPIAPTATTLAVIPVTPAATPTPFMHSVADGETMIGIAYQYGISLEELQAANPGVDPHFMGVGLQLIIPIGGEIPEVLPTPTPVPAEWSQPTCYRTGDGGAWCLMLVRNTTQAGLENLSAWIGLFTGQGENLTGQVANAPLNLLRPGEAMPLMAYFAPPLPQGLEARGEPLTALAVAADDTRYLDLPVDAGQTVISEDGGQAKVSGEVVIPEGIPTPSQLWVLAVAYDAAGEAVGARKWESAGEGSFEITVFSLGERIARVEVLIEARP